MTEFDYICKVSIIYKSNGIDVKQTTIINFSGLNASKKRDKYMQAEYVDWLAQVEVM